MNLTNARIRRVKPSETLAIKAKVSELKAHGRNIIDLSTGEPDIDTPEHIKEAAWKALRDGKTKYTAVPGIVELREAIAQKLRTENSVQASAETIIVTNGGKQSLYSAFDVLLEAGDEVVIPSPYWVSYPPMVEMASGKPVIVRTRRQDRYKIKPHDLEAALSERTRCVVLNSPSNPTGMGYTKDELRALGKVLTGRDLVVFSDEIYEKLTFSHFTFSSFVAACPDLADRVITFNGFSKTYAMTGWRLGYASGPKEIISAMSRHQSQTTSNVCSIAQYAALAAITGTHDFLPLLKRKYEARLDAAREELGAVKGLEIGEKGDGAFYLFVEFQPELFKNAGLSTSSSFVNFLLEKAGVAVVPGEAFGNDQAFRMSVAAADEDVLNASRAIAQACAEVLG